jgi:hypothetical protein
VASCCERGSKFQSNASHRVFTIEFGEYKPASTRALCPGKPPTTMYYISTLKLFRPKRVNLKEWKIITSRSFTQLQIFFCIFLFLSPWKRSFQAETWRIVNIGQTANHSNVPTNAHNLYKITKYSHTQTQTQTHTPQTHTHTNTHTTNTHTTHTHIQTHTPHTHTYTTHTTHTHTYTHHTHTPHTEIGRASCRERVWS